LGKTGDRLLAESIGKTISVYYNDTFYSVSLKTGKLLDFDDNNLLLQENGKSEPIMLPRARCVRIGGAVSCAQERGR